MKDFKKRKTVAILISAILHRTRPLHWGMCLLVVLLFTTSISIAAEKASELSDSGKPPDFADVKYGPHDRNVLDFWKAKSDKPTPLVLHFHGGGFVKGDKEPMVTRPYLKAGISVASANYRFVTGKGSSPFPAPMHDGARAVQFLRSKAKEWNIDPEQIALSGGSAGANIATWIALHDDLADPKSNDPIERLSTRVSCIIVYGGQTSNDPRYILKHIGGPKYVYPSYPAFYGIQSLDELDKPEIQKLVAEASAINHATKDDPPIFLMYGGELSRTPLPENISVDISIHHPKFGLLLKEKLDKLGVECHLLYKGKKGETISPATFLFRHLGLQQDDSR